MSDKLFIRFGIIFMVLTPILVTPIWEANHTDRWPDGTKKTDGYSPQDLEAVRWRLGSKHKYHPREDVENREYRNLLLSEVRRNPDVKLAHLPVSYLRWLVDDLEGRPYGVKYDVDCIRLLGVVKNYLKSLDNAEKCGKLKVLPEQTNKRDKKC